MAVVKPNSQEKSIITKRLKTQYPQMFLPGWGVAQSIKKARNGNQSLQMKGGSVSSQKQAAGLSPGDADMMRKKFPGMFK
jgi:hypothetical protein